MKTKNKILDKFINKKAIIAIIGLGYVGLPLAKCYIESGYKVVGIDVDDSKVRSLNSGKSYLRSISDIEIRKWYKKGFRVFTEFSKISSVDAAIICVPTPLNNKKEPDLSYVVNTANEINKYKKSGITISLESTTYPGTTSEILLPIFQSKNFKAGRDFFLVYSPEREDPGNKEFNTASIPKIVAGLTKNCLDIGVSLYGGIIDELVKVSSVEAAEMTKLLENIHRSVNIGLVNELKLLADKMNLDIHEIINAAATKPFGFTPYYPGPGIGGHCIPIDPFYLTWKAKQFNFHTKFIELAGQINDSMVDYAVVRLKKALYSKKIKLNKSKVLILGIAYKKDVEDTRESPSVRIISKLIKSGAKVQYSDPLIKVFPKMRKFNYDLESIKLSSKNLKSYDAVILVTDHSSFNYKFIKNHSKIIIDTRGIYKSDNKKIWKA